MSVGGDERDSNPAQSTDVVVTDSWSVSTVVVDSLGRSLVIFLFIDWSIFVALFVLLIRLNNDCYARINVCVTYRLCISGEKIQTWATVPGVCNRPPIVLIEGCTAT